MKKSPRICKLSPIGVAALVALGTFAAPSFAQTSNQSKLERVEITGSAIKRTDTETASPVEVITRKEIARTGATTINELIKSIPTIDISDAGEISANSPGGSGTARVRLRGLGDTNTLVLINGRRQPVNPLADASGAGAAFNINALPISAIERIEILKDGGSAIYGADAVAGVVNFILRKDYQGTVATASFGNSSRNDASERNATFVTGFGALDTDRYNFLVALDMTKRDPILRKDREISQTVDFRRFGPIPGFNLDGRSSYAPEGNILNSTTGALTGQTVRPCDPANFTNNACRYDFNKSLLTAYNGADRLSTLAAGTAQISSDFQAYTRLMSSVQKDNFEAHPVPDNFLLADGRFYAGRFMQGGPRITNKESTFSSIDLGVDGVVGAYDVKAGYSRGLAKSTNADKNYYDRAAYNAATQGLLIDPTVLTNDPAIIESIKVSPVRVATSQLDFFDAQVGGEMFKLPGGMSRFAVGYNWSKETLEDKPDPRQIAGTVVGSIQQSAVAASRSASAIYGELALPITDTIEAQIATRRDSYEGEDPRLSSKLGAKWKVTPEIALRGSMSESFKAATLKQLFANTGQGAINLTETQCRALGFPANCAGQPAYRLTGSNPDLLPEKGRSYNLGAVVDMGPLAMSADLWSIEKTDNISTLGLLSAIQGGFTRFDPSTARWFVFQNLQNFAQSQNTGIDLDARLSFKGTDVGNLTLRGATTYYLKQMTRTNADSPWFDYTGTYLTPQWRATFTATTETGPWELQGLVRATSGFADTTQPRENFGLLPTGGLRDVASMTEFDATVSYRGIKDLTLTGSIKNLLDTMPPFSATNATNNNYSQQGFAELYTSRGRFFQVTARYEFR